MLRSKMVLLLSLLILGLAAQPLLGITASTYVVGTCKAPSFPTFPTITAALNATPAPVIVQICPGTYSEQVQITQPVTLQGISSGDLDSVVILPPAGGLVATASDDFDEPMAPQIWINNVAGPVTISNLIVDGTGGGSGCFPNTSGIFFQNSSGTINRVTTRNQKRGSCGYGIWLQGGASTPSVLVEKSTIHDYDAFGIFAETNSDAPGLTATILQNDIDARSGSSGINLQNGVTGIITGNFVIGGNGIQMTFGPTGSITGNTIMGTNSGIDVDGDGITVKTNKIMNTVNGIAVVRVDGQTTGSTIIESNTISNASFSGIDFDCMVDSNVHSNTISDTQVGLNSVSAAEVTTNTYFGVKTLRFSNGC